MAKFILGIGVALVICLATVAGAAGWDIYAMPPVPTFTTALSTDCATSGASTITIPESGTYWLETRSDLVTLCDGSSCAAGGSWKVAGFVAEISKSAGDVISCRSPSGSGAMQITRSRRGTK